MMENIMTKFLKVTKGKNFAMNMGNSIKPWCNSFLSAIGAGGDYLSFFDRLEFLISSIRDNNILPENYQSETAYFVNTFIPSLVSSFMKIPRLAEGELEKVMKSLTRLVQIFTEAICNNRLEFGPLLLSLYDYNSYFFAQNDVRVDYSTTYRVNNLYTRFVSYFFDIPIQLFAVYLNEYQTIEGFDLAFKLFKAFHKCYPDELGVEFFNNTKQSLMKIFDSLKDQNLREIDSQLLKDLFNSTFDVIKDNVHLLNAAQSCLQSGIVEKQMIGAQIITRAADCIDKTAFFKWADQFSLNDFLLNEEMHQTLITTLIPAFKIYLRHRHLTDDQIWSLFAKAKTYHTALKDPYFKIIGYLLIINSSVALSFLDYAKGQPVDKELITFLISVVKSWTDTTTEIPNAYIQYIFSLINTNPSTGQMIIDELTKEDLTRFAPYIVSLIIEVINDPEKNLDIFSGLITKKFLDTSRSLILEAVLNSMASGSDRCISLFQKMDITGCAATLCEKLNSVWPLILKYDCWKTLAPLHTAENRHVSAQNIHDWMITLSTIDMSNSNTETVDFASKIARSMMYVSHTFYKFSFDLNFNIEAIRPLLQIVEQAREFVALSAIDEIAQICTCSKNEPYSILYEYLIEDLSFRHLTLLDTLIKYNYTSLSQPLYEQHGQIRQFSKEFTISGTKINVDDNDNFAFITLLYKKLTDQKVSILRNGVQVPPTACAHEFADKSEFTATQLYEVKKTYSKIDSIKTLIEKKFREKLMLLLDDVALQGIAYSILLRLPSFEISNDPETISALIAQSSGFVLRYHLHTAIRYPSPAVAHEIFKAISEFRVTCFGIVEAAVAILRSEYFEKQYNAILISKLFNALQIYTENDNIIIELLTNAIKEYPDTADIKDFREITQTRSDIIYSLVPALYCIDDKKEFFNYLLNNVKSEQDIKVLSVLIDSRCDPNLVIDLVSKVVKTYPESLNLLSSVLTLIPHLSEDQLSKCFNIAIDMLPEYHAFDVLNHFISLNLYKEKISEKVLKMLDVKCNQWNYGVKDNDRSVLDMAGLRNMGATCYMNSVLQILFANKDFRNLLYKEDTENKKWLELLKVLFWRMQYSKLSYIDTQSFISNFCFYGNEPINPRDQQDASEFLMILLDRLPIAGELYKITQVTYMDAENETVNEKEDYNYFIPLEVNNCKTITDSFNTFLEHEYCSGYFVEKLGRKVDIDRYSRIRKCPKYLAIQLKRFDYNLTTFQRIKVEGHYIVPNSIDISPISDNPEEKIYDLQGVVIHNGTAQGGHYTSMILMGDKIVEFNDTTVRTVTRNEFERNAFGQEKTAKSDWYDDFDDHTPSGYLLFYKAHDINDEIEDVPCPPEIYETIEKENNDFLALQHSFSKDLFNFIVNINDKKINEIYFFNVFVHMKLEDEVNPYINNYIVQISKDFDVDHHQDELFKVITECPNSNVVEYTTTIIMENVTKSFSLFMIEKIYSVARNWRCLLPIIRIIMKISVKDKEWFIDNKVIEKLLQVLIDVLTSSTSSVFHQNADFSNVARFICENEVCITDSVISYIMQGAAILIKSVSHSQEFIDVMRKADKLGLSSFKDFVSAIIAENKEPQSLSLQSLFIKCCISAESREEFEAYARPFVESPRISNEGLVGAISSALVEKDNKETRRKFLEYGGRILFDLATGDDAACRGAMEPLYLKLFKSVSGLSGYGRAENILSSKTEVKMCWHEKCEARVSDEEFPWMQKSMQYILEGFNDIIENPTKVIKGRDANIRLLVQLRVFLFMILRSGTIPEGGWLTLINLLKNIAKLHVKDDLNTLEIIRVFLGCNEETGKELPEYFEEITNALFPIDANESIEQAQLACVIFFLRSMLTPEKLRKLYSQDRFKEMFKTAFINDTQVISSMLDLVSSSPDFDEVIKMIVNETALANKIDLGNKGYSLLEKLGMEAPQIDFHAFALQTLNDMKTCNPTQMFTESMKFDSKGLDLSTKLKSFVKLIKNGKILRSNQKDDSDFDMNDLFFEEYSDSEGSNLLSSETKNTDKKETKPIDELLQIDDEIENAYKLALDKYFESIIKYSINYDFRKVLILLARSERLRKYIVPELTNPDVFSQIKEKLNALSLIANIAAKYCDTEVRVQVGGMILENIVGSSAFSDGNNLAKSVSKFVEKDGYDVHSGWIPSFLSITLPTFHFWEETHHLIKKVLSKLSVDDMAIVILTLAESDIRTQQKLAMFDNIKKFLPSRANEINDLLAGIDMQYINTESTNDFIDID